MAETDAAKNKARPCPKCGTKVPRALLLCTCGYHFQTKRVLAGDERKEPPDDESGGPGPAEGDEGDEPGAPPRVWLRRLTRLLPLFAVLQAVAAAIFCLLLLVDLTRVPEGGGAAVGLVIVFKMAVTAAGAAVSFVAFMGTSEALGALLGLERHVIALRRPGGRARG